MNNLWKSVSCMVNRMTFPLTNSITPTLASNTVSILEHNHLSPLINKIFPKRFEHALECLRKKYLKRMEAPPKRSKNPLGPNKPFAKGLVLKTIIKKPRKPNSANRKCVVVKLSSGKEVIAYVPGVGHNLQEHQYVLCRVGNLKDVPGVRVKCVRGAYDLPHIKKKNK